MKPIHKMALCLLAFAATAVSTMAQTVPPNREAIAGWSSADLRSAYLHCDRVSREVVMDVDSMSACVAISDVLLHRDFHGDLNKQLNWWKMAREEFVGSREYVPARTDPLE